jgi:hypothetical protein
VSASVAYFSYAPPVITGFSPAVIALGGLTSTIVVFGDNFGTDDGVNSEFWSAADRRVNGSLTTPLGVPLPGGAFVPPDTSPEACARSRLRDAGRGNMLRTVITCGVNTAAAAAGFGHVALTVAGQTAATAGSALAAPPGDYACDARSAPPALPLVFVCAQGYFAAVGERCMACPAYDESPALVGAECATPPEGRPPRSPDPYNFLWPCWLQPALGRARNVTVAEFPASFLYPRALRGWFDLADRMIPASRVFTERGGEPVRSPAAALAAGLSMRAACPQPKPYGSVYSPEEAADFAARDVCIVPCSPAAACLGANKCAVGYISTPPSYRVRAGRASVSEVVRGAVFL